MQLRFDVGCLCVANVDNELGTQELAWRVVPIDHHKPYARSGFKANWCKQDHHGQLPGNASHVRRAALMLCMSALSKQRDHSKPFETSSCSTDNLSW